MLFLYRQKKYYSHSLKKKVMNEVVKFDIYLFASLINTCLFLLCLGDHTMLTAVSLILTLSPIMLVPASLSICWNLMRLSYKWDINSYKTRFNPQFSLYENAYTKWGMWQLLTIRLMSLSFWFCHLIRDFLSKIFLGFQYFCDFTFFKIQ